MELPAGRPGGEHGRQTAQLLGSEFVRGEHRERDQKRPDQRRDRGREDQPAEEAVIGKRLRFECDRHGRATLKRLAWQTPAGHSG